MKAPGTATRTTFLFAHSVEYQSVSTCVSIKRSLTGEVWWIKRSRQAEAEAEKIEEG